MVAVVKDKAARLFGEGACTEEAVKRIAQVSRGDIKFVVSLLIAALIKAVSEGRTTVDAIDLPVDEVFAHLADDDKIILEILKEQNALPSGKLYAEYVKRTQFPKAERTFRDYMRNLAAKGFVRPIGTNKGRVYEILETQTN